MSTTPEDRRQSKPGRLTKEDSEEDNRFGESHGENRLNQNLGGSLRVAANGLGSPESDESNAERHTKSGGGYVNLTGNFC